MPDTSRFSFAAESFSFAAASISFAAPRLLWILAATAAVAIAAVVLLVWLLLRRQTTTSQRAAPTIGLAEQRALERDIASLMNDLSELALQVGQQLDARSNRLEQLMRAADERIEALREMPAPPRASVGAASSTNGYPQPCEADPRDLEIYRLSDEGLGSHEIAQRLGHPAGEIELILALRPRSADGAAT